MPEFKAPPPPPTDFPQPAETQNPVSPKENVVSEKSETVAEPSVTQPESQSAWNNKFQEQKEKLVQTYNQIPASKKPFVWIVVAFCVGLLLGAIMFGGSEQAPVQQQGLQGVVSNPDIRENLKRCGLVDPSGACVLYIMNNDARDHLAEDLFETAVRMTGRNSLVIKMDNLRYASTRIPPGYFAQIKIPAYNK